MIYLKTGDLLSSNCNILIHQANCHGVMDGGIAYSIKEKYPEAFEVDINYKYPIGDKKRLGCFSHTSLNNEIIVFNLYGQFNYGSGIFTDYEAFETGLNNILIFLKNNELDHLKIGLPFYIGCGKAGGDWAIVSNIINELSIINNVDIFLYKLENLFIRFFKNILKI